MIKIKFQALSNYKKRKTDKEAVVKLLEELQSTYPALYKDEEVVFDVKVDQDPHTLYKIVTFNAFIPDHGKIFAEAKATTFLQALSKIKTDLYRHSRKETYNKSSSSKK
jgi:hypothetical protein